MFRNLPPTRSGWWRATCVAGWLAWCAVIAAPRQASAIPAVVATTPISQAVGVSRATDITIDFATPLSPSTVIPANVLVTSSLQGTHAVTVTWNAPERRMVINPTTDFVPGERVTVTLGKGLRDLLGLPLPNGWHFEFSTWTAATPPGGFVAAASTWTIGSIALNLTAADLTGDGFPEAIFSDVVPDSLIILSSDGAGGFSLLAAIGRPDATLPRHVAVGDLDNDGRPDLVVCASGPDKVEVIRNLGGGAFAPAVQYPTGATPYGAYLGDLDADGDLDVATASFNGQLVAVSKNNGDGTLAPYVGYLAGPGADSPRWVDGADLDGDGDIDLVCCNGYSYDVTVFLNDGSGAFTVQPVLYPVGDSPQFCELRDFTGDGKPDLVTVNSIGESVSLLRGNGDGTFQPRVDTPVQGQLPYGLQVVDLDGDHDLDLVLPIRGVSAWQPVWNDGAGGFTAGTLYFGGNHCHTVAAADWDGDGDIDVIAGFAISRTMNYYAHESTPQLLSSLPAANSGGASVDAAVELTFNVDLSPATVTPAAFQVTGRVSGSHPCDAAWSGAERKVTVTPQDGFSAGEIVTVVVKDGALISAAGLPYPGSTRQFLTAGTAEVTAFTLATSFALPVTDPRDVVAADLDGDGLEDLAVIGYTSNNVTILLTSGGALPSIATTLPVGSGPLALAAGDLNGDGHTDLIVANSGSGSLTPLLNAGGILTPAATLPAGGTPYAVEPADLDNDGDLDLVIARVSPASLRVLRNDGGGSFSVAADVSMPSPPVDISSADLDRDGTLELIVSLPLSDEVRVVRRDASTPGLSFAVSSILPVGDRPAGTLPWDLDGDGWIDLTVSSYGEGSVDWMSNTGAGGFSPPMPLATAALPRGPWGTDTNGDGSFDVLALGSGDGSATLLRNDGAGGFSAQSWTTPGHSPYAAATGDFNGDGHVDVAILDAASGALRLILGGSAVGAGEWAAAPALGLLRAWPNPFREALSIRLGLPAGSGSVKLAVYDVAGRAVSRLHEGPWEPGLHEIRWDGRDLGGRKAASGVYFVRLDASGRTWTHKVLRLQ